MNRWDAVASRFHGMSLREKGLIIGCALLAVVIAVAKLFVFPMYAQYKKNVDSIRQRVATIVRYEALLKNTEQTDSDLLRLQEQTKRLEASLLEGNSVSEAGIYLQGILKPLLQKPHTQMKAIRTLPPAKKGMYTEISVQLDFQTGTAELAQILADIARRPKFLKVRKLHAQTGMYPGRKLDEKETVTVSMVVVGLSAAPMEDGAAAGGGNP